MLVGGAGGGHSNADRCVKGGGGGGGYGRVNDDCCVLNAALGAGWGGVLVEVCLCLFIKNPPLMQSESPGALWDMCPPRLTI